METVSTAVRTARFPRTQGMQLSPLLPFAVLPMFFIIGFILVVLWVSFQTGVIGTPAAEYTLDNYRAVFLTSQNSITLPAIVWSYWSAAGMTEASMLTIIMIALFSPLLALFWRFGRRGAMASS